MQHCTGFISAGRCDDLPTTITHVPVAAALVLNTPDDGRLRPKHVEWTCRNKTCTVLHQVGVSFDLYYDARKHKIKMKCILVVVYILRISKLYTVLSCLSVFTFYPCCKILICLVCIVASFLSCFVCNCCWLAACIVVVILRVFAVLCVYCRFYFKCRSAG